MLSAAIAAETEDGPIDLARVIDDVARLRPLSTLYAAREWTLGRGVQLLVDVGARLAPFSRDASAVVARLREIAGPERTEVCHFWGSPVVVRPPQGLARAYRLPPAGVPVLALTDLGLAPADHDEVADDPLADWLELAARLRANGSLLVALVPYPSRRWPRRALAAMSLIEWDRSTTTDAIRKIRLRGSYRL
jgi:hypothetical protein